MKRLIFLFGLLLATSAILFAQPTARHVRADTLTVNKYANLVGTFAGDTLHGSIVLTGPLRVNGSLNVDSIIAALRLTLNLTVDGQVTIDTVNGEVRFTGPINVDGLSTLDSVSIGTLDVTGLSSFTANAGKATVGNGDSVQVTISGLTTNGIASVSYITTAPQAPDTVATWQIKATNTLTLFGKFGWEIGYVIQKK